MDKNIGLWIDHKQAYLIRYERKKVETIPSNVEPRTHFSGGIRIGGTYNQGLDSELRYNDRYKTQLNKYFSRVATILQEADSIFIMGPGEAKLELKKTLEKNKSLYKKLRKIEPADKMTENQMIAYVREFFSKNSKN